MTCPQSTNQSPLPWRWPRAPLCALIAVIVAGAFAPACGKKGPPLAPLVRLPGAAEPFVASRLGATVYVRFTVPAKNQDNSAPADLSRVDVYGYTGVPTSDDDIVKFGTRVASVPIRRPPTREEEDRAREDKPARGEQPAERRTARQDKAKQAAGERAAEPGFDQGAIVTVTETWTPALAEPVVVPERRAKKPPTVNAAAAPAMMPIASAAGIPTRVYVAVGVNRKGRRGAFSRHAAVPVVDPPAPPGNLKLSHTETTITLEWTAPAGAPVTAEAPTDTGVLVLHSKRLPLLEGATWSYEVFDVTPKEQPAAAPQARAPAPPAAVSMPMVDLPVPVNQQPLTKTAFTDSRLEFGKERCYAVRTLEAFGALQEQSELSQVACVTPRDTYPPAAPKGLTAVVNTGVVSLIWDPNGEKDLDGYLVLRGEAPGGTLQPLTRDPIHETTFNDTTATPGTRYAYAVIAVDKVGNASAQSNRVEETAR